MEILWIRSSISLPFENQPVTFHVDGRSIALDGTYALQNFRTRWAGYTIDRVDRWRAVVAGPSAHVV